MFHESLAIMASQRGVAAVDNMEVCAHRLVVADALRVVAFHDVDEAVAQFDGVLLDHLVVANDVDDGIRRDDGDAVERLLGQFDVGEFDEAFFAHATAVEVVADGDVVLQLVESQQVHHLEERATGNMVDDDAVFQCGNGHFFLIVVHNF